MPEFLHIVWAAFLIILFFGGSIFVHELGHYLAARRRGLKVERFSIGFGPKLFSFTRDGVEWCVSLFPLGGYVALPQLADLEGIEGEYKADAKKLPPISYVDTLVVAVMGVVFNIIFAFALATVLWGVGRPTTDSQQTTTIGTVLEKIADAKGVDQVGPGFAAGLRPGDKILTIDGVKIQTWRDVKQYVVTGVGRDAKRQPSIVLQIERDSKTLTINAAPMLAGAEKLRSLGLLPQEELYIGQVFKASPAQKAGIQTGDQIVALNGQPVRTYYDYDAILTKNGTKEIELTVINHSRGGRHPVGIPPATAQNSIIPAGYSREDLQKREKTTATTATPEVLADARQGNREGSRGPSKIPPGISSPTATAETLTFTLTPQSVKINKAGDKQAMLGFNIEPKIIIVYQNPVEQICSAASLTWRTLSTLVNPSSDIKLNHLSGPPGIAWVIYRLSTDFRQVLSFIVLINVNLAILNLLPLPVLDGGQIVLATVNRLRRKPLPVKYVALMQNAFTVLLLGLMVYVIFFSDVPRLGREWKEAVQERKAEKALITPDFSRAE